MLLSKGSGWQTTARRNARWNPWSTRLPEPAATTSLRGGLWLRLKPRAFGFPRSPSWARASSVLRAACRVSLCASLARRLTHETCDHSTRFRLRLFKHVRTRTRLSSPPHHASFDEHDARIGQPERERRRPNDFERDRAFYVWWTDTRARYPSFRNSIKLGMSAAFACHSLSR